MGVRGCGAATKPSTDRRATARVVRPTFARADFDKHAVSDIDLAAFTNAHKHTNAGQHKNVYANSAVYADICADANRHRHADDFDGDTESDGHANNRARAIENLTHF
jgi:hypothetical protein